MSKKTDTGVRSSRENYNLYQRELMRKRRAVKAGASNAPSNAPSNTTSNASESDSSGSARRQSAAIPWVAALNGGPPNV